jgi:adenylate cyclase
MSDDAPDDAQPPARRDDRGAEDDASRLARIRAAALALDSQPALLAIARRARRGLPGDERYGDALSTAGDDPAQVVARRVAALQPDRPSVVQELGLSALQVWQSLSEKSGRGRGSEDVALLFTDLEGFSRWALKAGDAAAVRLLREVGEATEGAVADHRGRVVKRLGDGIMAVFAQPQLAVDAALDAADALARIDVDGYTPVMRAGVHWGRPRRLGGDYLGVDVNVAARVGAAAKGGELLVSEAACETLEGDGLRLGRAKRLKAQGAPRELRVRSVARA